MKILKKLNFKLIKKIPYFLILLLSIVSINIWAQPVTFDWGYRTGILPTACGIASVTDAVGNVFTVGTYTGKMNFSPTGTSVISSNGGKDIFIQCTGPTGALNWINTCGGSEDDYPTSICLQGSYLYITGVFQGTAIFGSASIISAGSTDAFFLKIPVYGGVSAPKVIGGPGSDIINSVSTAGTGKICITGSFEGFVDLDANAAGTSFATSNGLHDVFIEEINSTTLNLVWVKTLGGIGDDYGSSITSDLAGNIYVTGSFEDVVDMDPGLATNNISSLGASDIFIEKLNASGNFLWASNTGDLNADEGKYIKTDAAGNVFVLGNFMGAPDFDPGFAAMTLPSNGGIDMFMQELDSLGNFVNAFSQGGPSNDYGNAFALDASGNIYCTGTFLDSVDFNPTASISMVTSAGLEDQFIQKLDPSFNLVFLNTLKGEGTGTSNCIALDMSGNIFTTGDIADTTDFDSGVGVANLFPTGFRKYYIHKINNTGVYQWVKSSTVDPDDSKTVAYSTIFDNYGNVYTSGYFINSVDFDPGPNLFMLHSISRDPYVQKLDANGNFIWAVSFKTSIASGCCSIGGDAYHVASDSIGNVYVLGGVSNNTLDFDPGVGVYNVTITGNAQFLVKLDSSGNFIWVKIYNGTSGANHFLQGDLKIDDSGNIFFGGLASTSVDFDAGSGTYFLPLGGDYVCKLDPLGNFLWVKAIVLGISRFALDRSGGVAISGDISIVGSGVDVDPGPGVINMTGKGNYIVRLDASGNFMWANYIASNASTNVWTYGVDFDDQNNLYCTGNFVGTIDFNPGVGTNYLSSIGTSYGDVFVQKVGPSGNFIWAKKFGGSQYDTGEDVDIDKYGNVYITGIYTGAVDFDPGVGVYSWGGYFDTFIEKLTTDGDFVWVLTTHTNVGGAAFYDPKSDIDSSGNICTAGWMGKTGDIDPTSGVKKVIASGVSDAFVLKVNQCFINSIQTASSCNEFVYNGVTYTSTGTYGQVLGIGMSGCDSTITLDIIINGPDNEVTQSGNILTATQSGASYQWIDCLTNTPISGETAQSFNATGSGSFAVEISYSGCIDTSTCFPFIYTNIQNEEQPLVNVYPNPFTDNFTLEYFDNKHQPIQVEVTNILGQIVYKQEFISDTKQQVVLNDLQSGMYIVKMYTEYSFSQKHIVKE